MATPLAISNNIEPSLLGDLREPSHKLIIREQDTCAIDQPLGLQDPQALAPRPGGQREGCKIEPEGKAEKNLQG